MLLFGSKLVYPQENDDKKFYHILGAGKFGYRYVDDQIVVKSDIFVDGLRIRVFGRRLSSCNNDYHDHVELDGPIHDDVIFVIEKLLKELVKCKLNNGDQKKTVVYMNSPGGKYIIGLKLGQLFRDNQVRTMLIGQQICASSCATAFLGGVDRTMRKKSLLLFHSPYIKLNNDDVYCNNKVLAKNLKNYYSNMIGAEAGDTLYNRTIKYCSNKSGWIINGDAASYYGLANLDVD